MKELSTKSKRIENTSKTDENDALSELHVDYPSARFTKISLK